MSEGKVKWFNPRKGYGFIATDDGRDIFVHYASISGDGYRTLNEGDAVSFDIVDGEKGLRAENVVPQSASESTESTESTESIESAESTESTESAESAESTESAESAESTESTESQ